MLHQIVNSKQFSGAAGRVFEKFCAEVVAPSFRSTHRCLS